MRRLLLVGNSKPAAEVEILERDPVAAKLLDDRGDFARRFGERRGVGYLRADMRAESDQLEVGHGARLRVIFHHLRERHAELARAMAG